jgi:hypothetical protein
MLSRIVFRSLCVLLGLSMLAASSSLSAQGRRAKTAYLTPESSGPDFLVQGEYAGTDDAGRPVGVQVIAQGKGGFDAVWFPGGLPGAGWDGETKLALSGRTDEEGVTTLSGDQFDARIRKGILSGSKGGSTTFRLYKILRRSPTAGAKPPEEAIVLFDGTSVDAWEGVKIEEDNLLGVGGRTKRKFQDFHLHLEFRTPFMPDFSGQGRGNSGMYLLDQYECQILDSFGLEGRDNECGGIYQASGPIVNMCYPPLSWQTYDVDFQAARFDNEGKKVKNAIVTIRQNGIIIHNQLELPGATPGGGRNDERPGALYLQDHGDPVRFRNIWIVEKP